MAALSGCNFFWVNLIQIKCGDPQRSSAKCNAAVLHTAPRPSERTPCGETSNCNPIDAAVGEIITN
jgi:hypothetical protein